MTNRDTYNTSCKSAETTKIAQSLVDSNSEQETLQANKCNVGYTLQSGNFANLDSATRTENLARFNNALARERARQSSISSAKDTLRGTGILMSRSTFRCPSEAEAREWANAVKEKYRSANVQVYPDPRSTEYVVDVMNSAGLMKELGA
jgi:hypothetical protein